VAFENAAITQSVQLTWKTLNLLADNGAAIPTGTLRIRKGDSLLLTAYPAENQGGSATIAITSGLGSFSARKMTAGSDSLTYNLYKDSTCTQVWGDGTGSTFTVSDSVTLTSTSVTTNYVVYSRIAAAQRGAKVNAYSDNLLVTVTY